MKKTKKFTKAIAAGLVTLAAALGLAVGVGMSAMGGVLPFTVPTEAPRYEVNANGETYGTVAQARTPDEEPDLILAEATNGELGYLRRSELYGDLASLKTPEDNLAYSEAAAARGVFTINVYESDGRTVIGEFEVGGGEVSLR